MKMGDIGNGDTITVPVLASDRKMIFPGEKISVIAYKGRDEQIEDFTAFSDLLKEHQQKGSPLAIIGCSIIDGKNVYSMVGTMAHILSISFVSDKDLSTLIIELSAIGRCMVIDFIKYAENSDFLMAKVKVLPLPGMTDEEWNSPNIQKMRNNIITSLGDVNALFQEILDYGNSFGLNLPIDTFLSAVKLALLNIQFGKNFDDFIHNMYSWLKCIDLKFGYILLETDEADDQMKIIIDILDDLLDTLNNYKNQIKGALLSELTEEEAENPLNELPDKPGKNKEKKKEKGNKQATDTQQLKKEYDSLLKRINSLIEKIEKGGESHE